VNLTGNFTCVGSGQTCFGGAQCSNGICGNCGGIGEACCFANGNNFCTEQDTACNNGTSCVVCGSTGQFCCPQNHYCALSLTCNNGGCQ